MSTASIETPSHPARTGFRGLVWLLTAAALLGACGRPPAEPVLRLVEHGDGASARWARAGRRRPPAKLDVSRLGSLPPPAAVLDVAMYDADGDYDSRAALVVPRGGRYRFDLTPTPGSELRTALGYVVREEAGAPLPYRIRVTARDGGATGPFETLLDESLRMEPRGAWSERRIPLDAWAGRPIVLELAVPGPPPAEDIDWAAFATPEIVPTRPRRLGPDVILISLDTLRADHLGSYGYHRPTSPRLDRLAADGYRFTTAVSQAPWTRPSHRAILRGQFPISHGPTVSPPLPVTLWQAGYRTGAVTGGGQMSMRFGFHEGFETFRQADWLRSPTDVTGWIDDQPERSFFLFLHTFEIHDPYDHDTFAKGLPSGRFSPGFGRDRWRAARSSDLSDREKAYLEALYDGGIRFTDEALGRLFDALDELGVLDRAIVIVTSDHGEQFWDHGSWRHGGNVYDEMLLVPLIVHLPPGLAKGRPGRIVRQQVASIDIVPTVLDYLDLPVPDGVQGRSLRPLLEGEGEGEPVAAFAEHTNTSREAKTLRTGRLKLIYSYERGADGTDRSLELFDLTEDPGERRDLAAERSDLAHLLEGELLALIGRGSAETFEEEVPDDIDPELREELEALGYLDN